MGTETAITKKAALAAIKTFPKDRRPAALCALIGHSRIQTAFWGYSWRDTLLACDPFPKEAEDGEKS